MQGSQLKRNMQRRVLATKVRVRLPIGPCGEQQVLYLRLPRRNCKAPICDHNIVAAQPCKPSKLNL